MLHHSLINLVRAEDDGGSDSTGFAQSYQLNFMNTCQTAIGAGNSAAGKNGIFRVVNFEVLYLLLFIQFSGGLDFAGIVQERVGVVFLMSIFVYTFFGYMSGLWMSIGNALGIDGAWPQLLLAFMCCAAFLVFYTVVKPIFLGMIIFMVYSAVAESIGSVPIIIHILVLIGIIIAVKMLFKPIAKFYKFILVGVFSLFGSLMLLAGLFGLIGLPVGFDDYLQKFIDQKSLFGPLAESWNSLIWIIFIAGGAVSQIMLIRKGKRYEDKHGDAESKPTETE